MASRRSEAWIRLAVLAATLALAGLDSSACAQWFGDMPGGQFELAEAVDVEQIDNAVRLQLERAKAFLNDRQWDEAVEIFRKLAESSDGKLVAVAANRYVGLQDWCQRQLVALPPEALTLYRGRMDPVAREWYDRGISGRDRALLQNVADRAAASSYGDRALMALGEIALESGDYAAARAYWERIAGKPSATKDEQALAHVRARLVLVSIMDGQLSRAKSELAAFRRLYPIARGHFGGSEGVYVELLDSLLAESASSPPAAADRDWTTFAGNPRRNQIAPALVDVGAIAWRHALREEISPLPLGAGQGVRALRGQPSCHPLLVGDLLLFNDSQRILALKRQSGEPAWGQSAVIYQSEAGGPAIASPRFSGLADTAYTMTVGRNRLYARMDAIVTNRAQAMAASANVGCLVCLDLAAEGRLLWKISPEEGWAFEGSPLVDDRSVYVAMRRGGVRPQAAVACFDAGAGRRRWRRFVCAAETPARGMLPESTQNLLTLAGETLYCNTNLGAVAALRADDGRILWLSLYPRALRGDLGKLSPHWRRTLNPCVLHHGTLLAAPSDSPRIVAFDARTGQLIWQTGTEVEDAVDLLGAADDWLLAGGPRLYWISLREEDRGRVKHVWPDGPERPGYGRGLLAGDCVLWTTRDKLYVFDRETAQPRKVFDLAARRAAGGNLLSAAGQLLIATDAEVIAIDKAATGGRAGGGVSRGFSPGATNGRGFLQDATDGRGFVNITGDSCLNTTIFKPYEN
ncbi:MAG: PQQ-binding-like beta-propeller repeat protein [Thermoguttaceae bacterium]